VSTITIRLTSAAGWIGLAACAGAALGVSARVAMRVIAWQANVSPEFSFAGSAEVVLFGIVVGAPVALLVWACRHRVRLPAWAGVIVSLMLFGVLAVWQPPAARSALLATPDAPAVTALMFLGVFGVYGVVVDALWLLRIHSQEVQMPRKT
jgi:hypothetical protein